MDDYYDAAYHEVVHVFWSAALDGLLHLDAVRPPVLVLGPRTHGRTGFIRAVLTARKGLPFSLPRVLRRSSLLALSTMMKETRHDGWKHDDVKKHTTEETMQAAGVRVRTSFWPGGVRDLLVHALHTTRVRGKQTYIRSIHPFCARREFSIFLPAHFVRRALT